MMRCRPDSLIFLIGASFLSLPLLTCIPASQAQLPDPSATARPKVAGKLKLHVRERNESPAGSKKFVVSERSQEWDVAKTAIIVIDMWDAMYCKSSTQRIAVLAPKMNEVLTDARSQGVQIIHAPSGVTNMYAETPHRLRFKNVMKVAGPADWSFSKWCDLDPKREPPLPVDTSKNACDDPVVGPLVKRYTRQHSAIDIIGFDGVSDDAHEIFSFCRREGIENIVIMGVHTNMCILGRPFGIRAMTRLGKNVVLARDMTDAMYDPREAPYVSHARGTELVIEHIETYWCPTILSKDLRSVVPGSAGP